MARCATRLALVAAALIGAASAKIVKTDVRFEGSDGVVSDVVVGKFVHDDTVSGKRPGIVLVTYDGTVNEWSYGSADESHGPPDELLTWAAGSRVMIVDVLKAIGSKADKAEKLTNADLGQAVRYAVDAIKKCKVCQESVDPTQIAVVGYGLGGNAVMAALADKVPFQAGVVFTPLLDKLDVLDKGTIYTPKMLIMPGYDSIGMLDDLEKKNLEQVGGMLTFEIFVQHDTSIHFNVDVNSNYRVEQALRAKEQAQSFVEGVFMDAKSEGSAEPESSFDEDKVQYAVDAKGTTIEGMIVRDKKISGKRPVMLVVPPLSGFGAYPIERLQFFAKMGYVAMSANIYGLKIGTQLTNTSEVAAEEEWRVVAGDSARGQKFADRIMAANDYLQTMDFVAAGDTSGVGFGFGGTGMYNTYRYGKELKVHGSFHGGMLLTRDFSEVVDPGFQGYLAMYSGTQDADVSGDTMIAHLAQLTKFKGEWEMTRFSSASRGFTEWGSANYNARADGRAFESFTAILNYKMPATGSAHAAAACLLFSALAAAATLFLMF